MARCKVGDLAVIVGTVTGAMDGKIVRCISRFNGPWRELPFMEGWVIDSDILSIYGNMQNKIADKFLRPIRDQPGCDETLLWAGLPQPIEIDCTTKQGAEHE